jgi:hypothetical protein
MPLVLWTVGALAIACRETPSDDAVPTIALEQADAEISEPFTYVGAVRELGDGRLIVADARDKTLQMVDFAQGTVTAIGREGSGPGEYGFPRAVVPLPGDSTAVFDMLNSRYLTVLPTGEPGATFRLEDAASPSPAAAPRPQGSGASTAGAAAGAAGGALAAVPGLRNVRATDAIGRFYFEGSAFTFGPDGPVQADSVPIFRFDRSTGGTDTLAWLRMPKGAAQVTQSGTANQRSVQMRVGSSTPFDARDSWNVFPDGRVAIVRHGDYHLDIVGEGGQTVSGPPVSFVPVPVGAAEKESFRVAARRAPSVSMSVENRGSGTRTSISTAPAEFVEPREWPSVKPPFVNGAIFVRHNNEVWVQRQVRADDPPTFDVFDDRGRVVRRVSLPVGERVVGFGTGTVYTVRIDEDDLQYLQRYRG